jgi:hypothetical protein
MPDLAALLANLADESADLDARVAPLPEGEWARATPAAGWTIAHQIAHLSWTDHVALLSATAATPVRVEPVGSDGGIWAYGPAGAADRVTGPALDFCLLVTQRRHRADLALVATGPVADEWLDVALAFAGPPGTGSEPAGVRT